MGSLLIRPKAPDEGVLQRIVTLRSQNRVDSANNARIKVRDGQFGNQEQDSYISFDKLSLYQTLPNMNEYTNVIRFHESAPIVASNMTAVIPEKNYTASQLATELSTQMTATSAAGVNALTYTWTYDSQTGKFSVVVSAGGAAQITGYQTNLASGNTPTLMSKIIGMEFVGNNHWSATDYYSVFYITTTAAELPRPAFVPGWARAELRISGSNLGVDSNSDNKTSGKILSVINSVNFLDRIPYESTKGSAAVALKQFYSSDLILEWVIDFENGSGPHTWPATWMGEWSIDALQYTSYDKSEFLVGFDRSSEAQKRRKVE